MDTTEAPSSPSLGHYYSNSSDHSFPLTLLPPQNDDNDLHDDNDDFEFSFFSDSPDFSSVSAADDIFLRGQIIPTNPFFRQNDHRDEQDVVVVVNAPAETPKRMPLRKLMSEERPSAMTACSELDGIDAETYCLWTPQHKKPSKRWNFRNLLAHGKRNPKHAAAKLVGLFSGAGWSESQTRTK